MRFCMITTFYPPFNFGGDGVFVEQLSRGLAQRGHTVEVIHCVDSYRVMAGSMDFSAACDDQSTVTVHRLKSPFGVLSPLGTQQTGRPLLKSKRLAEILSSDFDVIHFHNISLIGGPAILQYGRGTKLYTLHEYWLVCPMHVLFKNKTAPCGSQSCVTCSLRHARPPQLWRYSGLMRESLTHIDAFIAPSRFSKKKHVEMGLEIPIVELPYFTARWSASETVVSSDADESPYFLFVGRLEFIKGVQTLLPLFRKFTKAKLLIAGVGTYERTLRRLAKDCPNIQFLGHQSPSELRRLYERAVGVIVPSIWYEVFGQVIIEAFSLRTPAIVRNIGGMPQIIEESGGGFVYTTDDELMRALDALVEDPQLRSRLGARGHAAFREKWTADVHIRQYLDLIERQQAGRSAKSTETRLRG